MSNPIALLGLGVVAPGLDGWSNSVPVLAGRTGYEAEESFLPPSSGLLKPMLRRRTTATIRLAISAGEQALAHSGLSADAVGTLFSSSDGDMEVADALCRALATSDHAVSPTRFHNSVHNAPAAYWSIASGSQAASTSIAAYSASFASGLLEAAALVCTESRAVLLVAYNSPAPHPMSAVVSVLTPFAVGMVLGPLDASVELGRVDLEIVGELEPDRMSDPDLERLRRGNSAAYCLPLLSAIARGVRQALVLPYLRSSRLRVKFEPGNVQLPFTG